MRIAVAGSGYYGAAAFLPLLQSHHEVVALVQNGRAAKGLPRTLGPVFGFSLGGRYGVAKVARHERIPIVWIDRMTENELQPLANLKPDLLVVAGFSIILKPPLLNLPRMGCLNVHAALLPHHRGPNPFSAVVLANEPASGVTFHAMDEGIDTGAIVDQVSFALGARDTAQTVYEKSCKALASSIVRVVDRVERDGLAGMEQDPHAGGYDKRPTPDELYIDWRQSAEEIDRKVRAYTPFLMARFHHGQRVVQIVRSAPMTNDISAPPGTVLSTRPCVEVATGKGSLRILAALCDFPPAWPWPAPWSFLRKGVVLT